MPKLSKQKTKTFYNFKTHTGQALRPLQGRLYKLYELIQMNKDYFKLESQIIKALKEIFDPEIPVNVYDLGLIYKIDIDEENNVEITMTLTAPNCPIADNIIFDVRERIASLDDVTDAKVNLVFDPPWNMDMMSEEAKLELGYL